MGYVSRHDHAGLAFRLSLPEDWAQDAQRRAACHVPPEVRYHTRHEQVPHGWVTGDEELGRPTPFRHALRERGERYVRGGPCKTTMRDLEAPWPTYQGRGRRPKAPGHAVRAGRQACDAEGSTPVSVRDGEKGPIAIEMITCRVQTRLERKRTGPAEWLVVTRRPLVDDSTGEPQASRDACDQDPRYRYQYYLTPTCGAEAEREALARGDLARVITAGRCIAASCKRGKGAVGMDEYQVRPWEGWHHHMALTLIAVWFLMSETHRGQQCTPALTLPPVRYGLSMLLIEVFCMLSTASICRRGQRQ